MDRHKQALDYLVQRPHMWGTRFPIMTASEVTLFRPDGSVLCQPDLVAIDFHKSIVLGEYKCGTEYAAKAIQQLQTANDFLRKWLGNIETHGVYIHGRYNRQQIW